MNSIEDFEVDLAVNFPRLKELGIFDVLGAPQNTRISQLHQSQILKKLHEWEATASSFQGEPVPLWAPIKTADGKFGTYYRSRHAVQRKLEREKFPLGRFEPAGLESHFVYYHYAEIDVPESRTHSSDILSESLPCVVLSVTFNNPFQKGFFGKLVSSTGTARDYLKNQDFLTGPRAYVNHSSSTSPFEVIQPEEAIEGIRPFVAPVKLDELIRNLHLVQRH